MIRDTAIRDFEGRAGQEMADELRQWRSRNGLTQTQVALLLAIPKRTIEDIEAGKGYQHPKILYCALRWLETPETLSDKAVDPAKPDAKPPVETAQMTGTMSAAAPAPQPFKRTPALPKTDAKTPAEPLPDWCRLKKTTAKSMTKPTQTTESDPFEEF